MEQETELTIKQRRFCEEYAVDFNGTQAAIRAGYSEHSATVIAYENLIKPYIRGYVEKLISDKISRTEIAADNLLRCCRAEYSPTAGSNPALSVKFLMLFVKVYLTVLGLSYFFSRRC